MAAVAARNEERLICLDVFGGGQVPLAAVLARLAPVSYTHLGLLENGESLYEAVRPHEHKHYMICKGCNAMVDLPACPLHALEEEIAGAAGFTVTDHVIQLYGYCRECRKDGKDER